MRYLSLDAARIVETVQTLSRRIGERFPDSGLKKLALAVVDVARDAAARSARIRKPNMLLRGGAILLCLAFLGLAGLLLTYLRPRGEVLTFSELIQDIDAILGSMVFIGAGVVFLVTLDNRFKRRRVLQALHELRALSHIVDMHQLSKDPELLIRPGEPTASSPKRVMSAFELERYLDYCSEMLSLIAKIAALYVQGFEDPPSLTAVDEIENLTSGLSRKIWQKIMVLGRVEDKLKEPDAFSGKKEMVP